VTLNDTFLGAGGRRCSRRNDKNGGDGEGHDSAERRAHPARDKQFLVAPATGSGLGEAVFLRMAGPSAARSKAAAGRQELQRLEWDEVNSFAPAIAKSLQPDAAKGGWELSE
jgi:hypothetical protein